MIIFHLPGTLDAFGMGIALALLLHKGQGVWARRLLPGWRNCLLWLLLAAALLGLAGALFLPRSDYWAHAGRVARSAAVCGLAGGHGAAGFLVLAFDGEALGRHVVASATRQARAGV